MFNIENPSWNNQDLEGLVQEICLVIFGESKAIVVVQRNLGWVGVFNDQPGADPMFFTGWRA